MQNRRGKNHRDVNEQDDMTTKMKLDLSNYGIINAGDDTHEKVGQALKQYFGKFNRRMKIHIKQRCYIYQLPCYILKLSFNECKQYLLNGPIFEQFQARLEDYDVIPEILRIFKIDEQFQHEMKLKAIFSIQYEPDTQEWDYQKAAYATLIDVTNLRSINPLDNLERNVHEKLSTIEMPPLENLHTIISEAAKITWKMITLVPPAFIHFSDVFVEDWMEKKLSVWDQEAPDHPTIYSQPVFFYNALGQVGQKAVVGNKLILKNMEVIQATEELDTDLAGSSSRQQLNDLEMYFYCELCDSCIYGIEKIQTHKHLCCGLEKDEAEASALLQQDYLFNRLWRFCTRCCIGCCIRV